MTARRSLAAVLAVLISAPLLAQTPGQRSAEDAEFLRGAYLATDTDVILPVAQRQVTPQYTSEAMRAKLQGEVVIQAVVGADGAVDRARVTQSLDSQLGLDAAALVAVKRWTFKPGTKDGKAVPVAVTLSLQFRLH
jgi:periplasmic protein TonB